VWIDVLLSAGVQVEVCRVKAKDASASDKKRAAKRKGSWGKVVAKPEMDLGNDDEEEEEEGETKYESGEEGKREGYWEGDGKRVNVR